MVPAKSLIFMQNLEKKKQQLRTGGEEGAVAFQLGAGEVADAVQASELIVRAGFREINLNCGCPSKAVRAGDFGAVLMKNPALVASIMRAMSEAFPHIIFSVKCRIGVDEQTDAAFLDRFVEDIITAAPQVKSFHIHARKAILKGLNPRQNRHVPPLDYQRVYDLKKKFPHLEITINGGIQNLDDAQQHLQHCDGVMIGRAAIANPFLLMAADRIKDMAASQTELHGQVKEQVKAQAEYSAQMSQDFFQEKLYPFLHEFDGSGVPTSAMLPFLMNMIRDGVGARLRRAKLGEAVERARRRREKLPLLTAWQMMGDAQSDAQADSHVYGDMRVG